MKIGIDISQIVYGGGVSVYTQNLLESLLRADKSNEYVLFFSSLRRKINSSFVNGLTSSWVNLRNFKFPQSLLDFIWNRLHILPIENFIGRVDVFHSSDWTQPPSKFAKLVTTIHDLSFLKDPETVHPKVLAVQKRRLNWVKKEVNHIIAVSEATKKEIIELLDIPEKKISVIYEALPEEIKRYEICDKRYEEIKRKYGISKPYLFAYGSQAPRKNIKRIIAAFKQAKLETPDLQLVICGAYKEEKKEKDVMVTGFLPREEMLTLFSQATVKVYPSLYEGFGLPILEAFCFKVPVVTSNTSSLPEVAGDAAILVNPLSVDSIAEGIKKVILDKKGYNNLIARGGERLKLFSWEKTAEQTIEVYEKMIG